MATTDLTTLHKYDKGRNLTQSFYSTKRMSNVPNTVLKTEGDSTWKTTTSFNRDDLPLVAKVADIAHTYIFGLGHGDTNG